MLVTNLRDEDSEDLLAAVRMLQRRHLVVVASLRERAIDEALDGDVHELPDALRAAAAARYLAQRAAVHDALRHQRVMVLDVTCAQLPAALVDKYLAIRSEEHTSELQSLMRISYAVLFLKKTLDYPHRPLVTNIKREQ